jgi:hypothetical protein
MLWLRQHGHDNVTGSADFASRGGSACTGFDKARNRLGALIENGELVAMLQDIHGHRCAHDAQPNKSNFHLIPPVL